MSQVYIVAALESEGDSPETQMGLCAIAHCVLELRSAVSLFSRVNIQERDLIELENHCLRFFNIVSTMLKSVSPTVWTIGYAVPYHTRILFNMYKLVLRVNSMQGREAKHVRLQQYAKHASLASRWNDFVSNIWLRRADPHHFGYTKCTEQYIPACINSNSFCFCGYQKDPNAEKCNFCSTSLIYKEVAKIV